MDKGGERRAKLMFTDCRIISGFLCIASYFPLVVSKNRLGALCRHVDPRLNEIKLRRNLNGGRLRGGHKRVRCVPRILGGFGDRSRAGKFALSFESISQCPDSPTPQVRLVYEFVIMQTRDAREMEREDPPQVTGRKTVPV